MAVFSFPTPPDFQFAPTIWSHGWYQLAPFGYEPESRTLTYIQRLADGEVVNLTIVPDADDTTLTVTVEGLPDTLSDIQQAEIQQVVRRILSLDQSLQPLYTWLADKPHYAWVEKAGAGRMMRSATVWEDLVKTLLTTNTTWNMTKQMVERVCALGHPIDGESGGYAFPTPADIASLSLEVMSEQVRAGYRSAYLHELATAVAAGHLMVETWDDLPADDLYKTVRSIKGFGDYAASTMLRIIGRHDRLTIDSVARQAYRDHINGGNPATDADIRAYYAQFEEWCGLVQWLDIMWTWLQPEGE